MATVLFVIGVFNILVGLIGCLASLGSNLLIALLFLMGGIIGSVPYFVWIRALEDMAALREEQMALRSQMHHLLEALDPPMDDQSNASVAQTVPKETSRHTWKCVKCQTLNKPGIASCVNCGASYSPWVNGEGVSR